MREKRLIKRRLLSLFLSVLMLIGILPLNLVKVYASGGVKMDETNFPDPIVLKCVKESFQGMDELDSKTLNRVDFLSIRNDVYYKGKFIGTFEGAKDLTGLNLFPNLNAIALAKPNMKSIESLRGCNKLKEITIEGGSIDSFHLQDDNISSVDIRDCKINSFKLYNIENGYFGAYEKHGFISLNNCGLSNIETFGNMVLVDLLVIDNNKFTAFDINKKIIFDLFSCKNNQIETLNFGEVNDFFLKRVDCSVNRLKNLDISKLQALEKLNCSSNQLSRLDIGDNRALKELDCSNNGLSRIDIGNNDNLQVLNCSNNQFQGNFIADSLKGLKKLNVSNNKFTNIVFFDQNNIEELDCSNNAIPYLKNFPNLKTFKGDNQQVDVVVDRNDRRIRYKNFVLIELPQGNSKVKELSGGKLIDGSYFGEFIKVDESLPSKVTYKYEVSPGMFLDVTMNITYTELDPTNVVSMKIKNQPTKLTYTDGEKLDLSGLVVTLTDNQGLTKDVAFADFAANGITTNPTDGTALTLADNATPVTLTKGSLQDETANLTVNAKVTPQDPIVGPVDPSVTPNPDEAKNWTVTFAADPTKGKIDAKNTFYVPKTAGKTLADLANDAPEVTVKEGFKFTGWNPALEASTAINGNMTINAEFETTTTPQDPKVVVPDPTNPGTVPTGRVRVTFDAGEGNTIEGKNRYKYLDVLENTAWTDREVTDEIPAKAKYKDNTKTFDKWDKEVPTTGNVEEKIFTAIYTGKSFDLFADTLSAGETGIIVRTSIPEVKITLIKGGEVLKETYTNDLGVVTIILNYKVEKGDVYKIIGEMKGYKTQEIFATVVSK